MTVPSLDKQVIIKAGGLEKRGRKTWRYLFGIVTSNEHYGICQSERSSRRTVGKVCRNRVICVCSIKIIVYIINSVVTVARCLHPSGMLF